MQPLDDIHAELLGTLKRYWGYDSFRPVQEEIIRSVCEGRDTLALMPTGGGKSLTYQVPTMLREGLCIVVTPLIALMKDQVDRLRRLGINAAAIHSGLSMRQIDIVLDNCVYGDVKFLYVAPERLVTEAFRLRVERMRVSLLAVDEAHCISQWGYDFRPSYLRIAELRERLPEVPVLALTASATPAVARDIMRQLRFAEPHVLRSSFARPNLSYAVRHDEDKNEQLLRVVRNVAGSGIVYVRTRDGCEQLTGIPARRRRRRDLLPRRPGQRRTLDPAGGVARGPHAHHDGYQCLRHGNRQGRRAFRRPLLHARLARKLLSGSGPCGTRRKARLCRAARRPGRRRARAAPLRPAIPAARRDPRYLRKGLLPTCKSASATASRRRSSSTSTTSARSSASSAARSPAR